MDVGRKGTRAGPTKGSSLDRKLDVSSSAAGPRACFPQDGEDHLLREKWQERTGASRRLESLEMPPWRRETRVAQRHSGGAGDNGAPPGPTSPEMLHHFRVRSLLCVLAPRSLLLGAHGLPR